MLSTKQEKELLRAELSAVRGALSKEQRAEADSRINARLSALVSYRFAPVLLFYYPAHSEADVRPALRAALKAGRKVALPLCDKNKPGAMTFRLIRSEEELSPGKFGVMEPSETTEQLPEELLKQKDAIAIVPALSFDKKGYRLGYGGGYYDRFLSYFAGTTVGICYASLLKEELPRGFFDRRVDLILTEQGVYKANV